MGGGVLAHTLADNEKRVLLLERGDLIFTTHSLNTTRPHADLTRTGPTQVGTPPVPYTHCNDST